MASTLLVGPLALQAQTPDCNNNGQLDSADISSGSSSDCNFNGIPDECESAANPLADCNLNGILDACEPIQVSNLFGAFSSVIAMSGDTLLVTDPVEPAGPDEEPEAEPELPTARLVEVFRRHSNIWVLDGHIAPADEEPGDAFGASLSIDGDLAVVGAPLSNSHRGAAYVFVRTQLGWMQVAKLTAENPSPSDEYGRSVAILGSDIIVGAPQAIPENPNNPDQIFPSGYAEIWSQNGTDWQRSAHVTETTPAGGGEENGSAVALAEGGWAFVGSPSFAAGSGRVHVYQNLGGFWIHQASLAASDSIQNLGLGASLSTSGSTLVASASGALGGPAGLGPVGAVYTFNRTGTTWTQVDKTMSTHPETNGYGDSVSICEDQLVVGEPNADSSQGLAHLYRRSGNGWELRESLRPIGTQNGDRYGAMVGTNGTWTSAVSIGLPAVFMTHTEERPDCDGNGLDDRCEITSGATADCNGNGIPDGCDITSGFSLDCDGDGIPDACNLLDGTPDCNNNGIPDSCDIALATSGDCNGNSLPDDCETDCNENGTPDDCDLSAGIGDCNANSIPDSCEIASGLEGDCDLNGVPDSCELQAGEPDCDNNGQLDVCQIEGGASDCDGDGIPDACELVSTPLLDCNANDQIDSCDIAQGLTVDCDGNGVPDECQLTAGSSIDCNTNGILDECEDPLTVDPVAPEFLNIPVNILASADLGSCSTAVGWVSPSASDNCGPPPLVSADHLSGAQFPVGTTEVTFSAQDLSGNIATTSFLITITDDEDPTISDMPSSFTITNDADVCGGTATWLEPNSADNCAVDSLEVDVPSGSLFSMGDTLVTYTSTDSSGRSTTASFTVTVLDDQNPEFLTAPADLVLDSDLGSCGAIASWESPTTSDNCGVLSLGSSASSSDFFPTGTTEVSMTLTDVHNNTSMHIFSVTVNDVENPQLVNMPGMISQTADLGLCGASVTWEPPTTTDNCPGEALSSTHLPGDFFEVGETMVTYTLADSSDNTVLASFSIQVTDDEAPLFESAPGSQDLGTEPDQCGSTATWDAPATSDNCGVSSLTSSHQSGDFFLLGTTTVVMTLVDLHGQTTTHQFDIVVSDTQAPLIHDMPASVTQSADRGACGAIIEWTAPTTSDNCPSPSLFTDHPPGSFFPVGTTTVTYTASDANGLDTSSTFQVSITDDEAPGFITSPGDMALTTNPGECVATVVWDAPQTGDNCAVLSLGSDYLSGTHFEVGSTLVTMTLVDINGNASTHQFTIAVTDDELPQMEGLPADFSVTSELDLCGASVTWTEPTTSDNCSGLTTISSHSSGDYFPVGPTVVDYTVTDASGNEVEDSFVLTVTDDQDPVFDSAPESMTLSSGLGDCGAVASWDAPTVSDNCETTNLNISHESGDFFNVGTTFVTLSLADGHGNLAQHTFIVTVIDDEDPLMESMPDDISQSTDPGLCGASVNWNAPTASDNCALGELVTSHQPGEFFPVGTTTVSYSQADENGNVVTAQFFVTISDDEAPSITTSGNLTLPAPEGTCTLDIDVPTPTTDDNCVVVDLYNDLNGTDDASGTYHHGSTVLLWAATDNHGNTTVVEQTVTIVVPQQDCNGNGNPDVCDIAEGGSEDCDGNGVPDECDLDCNENGLPDSCDIASGTSSDCNDNDVPDSCDLLSGDSLDTNANGALDECEPSFRRGDANSDGSVDIADAIFMLYSLMLGGPASGCTDATDANDDGLHDISDIIYVLNYQFQNGGPPPAPGPVSCGIDMTPSDGLGCDSYGGCP
ncbi:MAG: HYR domain-containing protein [Planctomycetota bacterium]|nr:HYR domain-containing protein [Planctomycetota bacterium]